LNGSGSIESVNFVEIALFFISMGAGETLRCFSISRCIARSQIFNPPPPYVAVLIHILFHSLLMEQVVIILHRISYAAVIFSGIYKYFFLFDKIFFKLLSLS
jgi:hypothetical protein